MTGFTVSAALPEEFDAIQQHLRRMQLDDRRLEARQFSVIRSKDGLAGFARILPHVDCDEYCSLGILEHQRCKGLGQLLTSAIVQRATQPLYLVCITPAYFERQGFKTVSNYPTAMQNKLDYCQSALAVPEPYVVMRYWGEA